MDGRPVHLRVWARRRLTSFARQRFEARMTQGEGLDMGGAPGEAKFSGVSLPASFPVDMYSCTCFFACAAAGRRKALARVSGNVSVR